MSQCSHGFCGRSTRHLARERLDLKDDVPSFRNRLARDALHGRNRALAHKRDQHRVGAHAVAGDAAGGVGGTGEHTARAVPPDTEGGR